jgi:hypothetical protein
MRRPVVTNADRTHPPKRQLSKPGKAHDLARRSEDDMLRVAVVTGSTRPGRVDIADYNLPLLNEHLPRGHYHREHTKR